MVTASLWKQLSLLAVKCPKRQGVAACCFCRLAMGHLTCILSNEDMVFMQVEQSRQAWFDSGKIREVSLSTRKHCSKFFLPIQYHSLKDSNVCGYRYYQWEPEAFRLREDPSLVLRAIYFQSNWVIRWDWEIEREVFVTSWGHFDSIYAMFIFTFLGKVLVGFSYHYINILSSILYSIIMGISGRSRGETWGACPPLFLPQTKAPPNFF